MTGNQSRAFWKLGERFFLGSLPRDDFTAFLRAGFAGADQKVDAAALERILDLAEDVPYNVQRLAYSAWEMLRVEPRPHLNVEAVERAMSIIVRQEHPAYAQLWASLTKVQKTVLKAVILERGRERV